MELNNDTFALSNVSITEDYGITVKANWYVGEQEYKLNITGNEDSWRMYGPTMCSGDYHPE